MKKYSVILFLSSILIVGILVSWKTDSSEIRPYVKDYVNMSVEDMLVSLGEKKSNHSIEIADAEKAKVGLTLITEGSADYKEFNGKRISPYFVCTDCHNLTKEWDDISSEDPQLRLDYAVKNDIPFLPGSTLWGIYNRETFYNKDYVKKYGELVLNARDTLPNAIQVCAKYCSSGRYLEDWELDAIMHYFKSTELEYSDLNLSKTEVEELNRILEKPTHKAEAVSYIKSKYVQGYDATFMETQDRKEREMGKNGDPVNGEKIFSSSCMHCHENARVTFMGLNDDVLTGRKFWKHRKDYDSWSMYQITRHGTYPISGRRQYMPLYTKEKMSDQQLEDLMAYVKQLAKK